jgi:hypothetical protein
MSVFTQSLDRGRLTPFRCVDDFLRMDTEATTADKLQIDPSVKPVKLNIQTKDKQTIQIQCECADACVSPCGLTVSRARWTPE